MANPITWQNVTAPTEASWVAGNLMKNAGTAIDAGINKFSGVYDQYQKDRSQENTAAYEAELAKYTTPEALKAAQDGGVLAALGKQFGMNMDQGVLKNGATEAMKRNTDAFTAAQTLSDNAAMRARQTPDQKLEQQLIDAQTTRKNAATLFSQGQDEVARQKLLNDPKDKETLRVQQEAAGNRLIEEAFNQKIDTHKSNEDTKLLALGRELADQGLPVTASGYPDTTKIATNPEMVAKYQAALKESRFAPITDTAAGQSAVSDLFTSGVITATQKNTLLSPANQEKFSTVKPLIGADKLKLEAAIAARTAQEDEARKNGALFVTSTNPLEIPINDIISKALPDDKAGQRIAGQVLNKIQALGGIQLTGKDGKPGELIPLSLPLIQRALAGASSWWDNNRNAGSGGDFTQWATGYRKSLETELNTIAGSDSNIKAYREYQKYNKERTAADLLSIQTAAKDRSR